jgi:hypothetical protein
MFEAVSAGTTFSSARHRRNWETDGALKNRRYA